MEDKYINKILNFSDEIINNAKELVINKEQAKEIIKELKQDYVPKALINIEIVHLKEQKKEKDKTLDEMNSVIKKQQGTETDLDSAYQYYDETYDEKQKLIYQVNILKKLLGE